jgi:phosphoribosyl-ATP pyrophosphohydrolase
MWIILQHRLTGTVIGAVPSETRGFEQLRPGTRVEFGARTWRIRGRFVQSEQGPTLILVDATEGSADAPPSTFQVAANDIATAGEAEPFLAELDRVIDVRKASTATRSYTRSLFDGGAPKIAEKLREEADELGRAIADESDERVASEAADVLFHLLVGARSRDLSLADIVAVLARRFGVSGHVEKASRIPPAI